MISARICESDYTPLTRADKKVRPILLAARQIADSVDFESLPFFSEASGSVHLLERWAAQELAVSGPFSQIVLDVASGFTNVHQRAVLVEVARGEHLGLRGTRAHGAHPWLLKKLCDDLGVNLDGEAVRPETEAFIDALTRESARSPLAAVGAIGVGNERLILTEYKAIKRTFARSGVDVDYAPFLVANMSEDDTHAALAERLAATLIAEGHDPEDYLSGAAALVDQRIDYYKRLVE